MSPASTNSEPEQAEIWSVVGWCASYWLSDTNRRLQHCLNDGQAAGRPFFMPNIHIILVLHVSVDYPGICVSVPT